LYIVQFSEILYSLHFEQENKQTALKKLKKGIDKLIRHSTTIKSLYVTPRGPINVYININVQTYQTEKSI